MSETALGRFLREDAGCIRWRAGKFRGWQFPPLSDLRAVWEKKFGNWKWDEPGPKDWE
jgi:hypothetical protein